MSDQFLTDLNSHMKAFARARYICALTHKTGVSQITLKAADLKTARREVRDFLKEHPAWNYGYIKERNENDEGVVFIKVATIKQERKIMSKKIYGNGKRINPQAVRSIVFSSISYARYFIQNANEVTLREALKEAKACLLYTSPSPRDS